MNNPAQIPALNKPGPPYLGGVTVLWAWILAGAAAMTLYTLTLAPGVLWGDSGEAQLRVFAGSIRGDRSLARAHCTYYAVAVAIRDVCDMEATRAANLTAALAGALTVANFAAVIARLARYRVTVLAGATLLAGSHTLWQMSTGAEVVTFYTMCLSAELLAVLCFVQTGQGRWFAVAALVNGLALSTHNFAMLLWPAYAMLAVMAIRKRVLSKQWLVVGAAAWCVGALPIAILTVMEWRQVGSASDAVSSLLFGRFQREVLGVTVSVRSLAKLAMMAVYNFPTPLLLLAPIGVVATRSDAPKAFQWFIVVSALTFLIFVIRYNIADQYTFMVPVYVIAAIPIMMGVDRLLAARRSRVVAAAAVVLAALGPIVYGVTPAIARKLAPGVIPDSAKRVPHREAYDWFFQPWRAGYDGAARYAADVFEVLPPDALLVVLDTMRPPLDYLQGREGRRLDVYLTYSPHDWPGREHRTVTPENANAMVGAGKLYVASPLEGYVPGWMLDGRYEFVADGPVYQVKFAVAQTKGANRRDRARE